MTYFREHAASPTNGALSKHGEYLTPVGGLPAKLSLQFPGWPTPLVHRMMMFVCCEVPAQKAPFGVAAGQMNWPVVSL